MSPSAPSPQNPGQPPFACRAHAYRRRFPDVTIDGFFAEPRSVAVRLSRERLP